MLAERPKRAKQKVRERRSLSPPPASLLWPQPDESASQSSENVQVEEPLSTDSIVAKETEQAVEIVEPSAVEETSPAEVHPGLGDSSIKTEELSNVVANSRLLHENGDRHTIAASIYPNEQLKNLDDSAIHKNSHCQLKYPKLVKANEIKAQEALESTEKAIEIERIDSVDVKIPKIYPTVVSYEKDEHGLLSENQLLAFYHNQIYESAEDFVEQFLLHEEFPNHDLHGYLERYKIACQKIVAIEADITERERNLKEFVTSLWSLTNKIVKKEGRCGDQRNASGSVTYLEAKYDEVKNEELWSMLQTDVTLRLDQLYSLHVERGSLFLQIQWLIIDYTSAFMKDHLLVSESPPCFSMCEDNSPSRRDIRYALSDLFSFLRFPNLPSHFAETVSSWISEIVSVLLRACTSEDQQYLLCQVLRLQSPVREWAAPLLQSFMGRETFNDRVIIDHNVAMLSILLSPIRGRENFLRSIADYQAEETSWTVIGDEDEEISLAAVNEMDLISFFDQFPTEVLFAKAIKCFVDANCSNLKNQILSMVSFEFLLLKLLNDGLRAYNQQSFRQFCKQIGNGLRQSVRCLGEFYICVKEMLSLDEIDVIQKEFDRIVLYAVYYIAGKQGLGLWQFLVDLPYHAVSEMCRVRCQIIIRKKAAITISELYDLSESDLYRLENKAGILVDILPDLPTIDSNFMVTTLASIISSSESDAEKFVLDLFEACFLDVSMRDTFYKVGSEAMATLIDKKPYLLHKILLLIDRNMDALDQLAMDVLATASLSKCRLSESDIGVICGKWLINQSPDHPASRLARCLLGSMNWGDGPNGQLWLPESVHIVCADTIVKGHLAQCKSTNSLIAKSWSKVAKLASKVPDYEQQFDSFCWDILLRLKLPIKHTASSPSANDLASFYVSVVRHHLESYNAFVSSGLPLWCELVTSGCHIASADILVRLISLYPDCMAKLVADQSFALSIDRLLQSSQSYATQLISGWEKFPNQTVQFLSSAISYHMSKNLTQSHVNGWIYALCCKRSTQWNTDPSTIYLIGTLVRNVLLNGLDLLPGVVDLLRSMYSVLLQERKVSSKGVLSWFTGEEPSPPLIASKNYVVSPWATFVLLLAEEKCYVDFYDACYLSMVKHPNYSLEQAVKKGSSKSHTLLTVDRFHFHRLLEFACTEGISDHPIYPLVLHNLAIHLFAQKTFLATEVCFADRYFTCSASVPLFEKLQKNILPRLEHRNEKNLGIFYNAFARWLSNKKLLAADVSFNGHSVTKLSKSILSGNPLMDYWHEIAGDYFVTGQGSEERKWYSSRCHLGEHLSSESDHAWRSIAGLIAQLTSRNNAKPCPAIPQHQTLPVALQFELNDACVVQRSLNILANQLGKIYEVSESLRAAKKRIEFLDQSFLSENAKLYDDYSTDLGVVLKCGSAFTGQCTSPTVVRVTVTASHLQSAVESEIMENRQKRSNEIAYLYSQFLLDTSLHCANLEKIASKMTRFFHSKSTGIVKEKLQISGRELFYRAISSIDPLHILGPIFISAHPAVISKLGQAFIADQANEQYRVAQMVIDLPHIAHLLLPYYTPHCLVTSDLLNLYAMLNERIHRGQMPVIGGKLLSLLDIMKTGDKLSQEQFSKLMSMAFTSMVSSNDAEIRAVCGKHFVDAMFYRFPLNFVNAFKIVLSECTSSDTPDSILDLMISNLGVDLAHSTEQKPMFAADVTTSVDATNAIAEVFQKWRNMLQIQLYPSRSRYLSRLSKLARFFIFKMSSLSFYPESNVSKTQDELQRIFEHCTKVFGPLIEPFGSDRSPWPIDAAAVAADVLDNYVASLNNFHLLYDAHLQPDSQNVIMLFWRYYVNKISFYAQAASHYHQLLATRLIILPWNLFWPTLNDLKSMEKIMSRCSEDITSFVTQIVIRTPWLKLANEQVHRNFDDQKMFYSSMFTVVAWCASRPANYTTCRASLPNLLKSLLHMPWALIETQALDKIAMDISSFSSLCVISQSDDVALSFNTLFLQVCSSNASAKSSPSDPEQYRRLSIFVRTQCALMLRSGEEISWMQHFYKQQIIFVNNFINSQIDIYENLTRITKELIAFFPSIKSNQLRDELLSSLLDWIDSNCESSLILLMTASTMSVFKNNHAFSGLKIMEKCIGGYFRRIGSHDWNTLLRWTNIPEFCRKDLFSLPSSQNGGFPFFWTMNAYLMLEAKKCPNRNVEMFLQKSLSDYIYSIKAKYVVDGDAFLMLVDKLQKSLIKQYEHNIVQGNEHLMQFLRWLERVHSDDKSSSFFSMIGLNKKQHFPIKVRYVCHVMNLFITQQTLSAERAPRLQPNMPVLNSRIEAFKELSVQKQYAEFQSITDSIQPYFTQVQRYNLSHSPEMFARLIRGLYSDKCLEDEAHASAPPLQ